MKKRNYLLLILGILFCLPCIAFSAGEEINTLPTDFPNLMPNAAVSIQRSEFGPERMNVACYGTGQEKASVYRLFKKFYKNGEEALFEVSPPQPESDFDLFMKSWNQCDVMVAGYDENGEIMLATPIKRADISQFTRQSFSSEPRQSADRLRSSSSSLNIDATQFPLIRVQGLIPEGSQPRSANALPVVEEAGVSQKILEYSRSDDRRPADILLLVSNSASMNYHAPWFMPKLRKFLRGLGDSGMNYRIGLVPFGSAEQTAGCLENGPVFYPDAAQVLSALESKLAFDSPYDDAVSAIQKAAASASWDAGSKKIIILAGNQAADADSVRSREIVAAIQKQDIRCFAFLPEQSFLTQLLTRRTRGAFFNFYNDELTAILSDLNPSAASVSLVYQTDQLTGTDSREISLYFTGTGAARSSKSQAVSLTYTPPAPFDLMLMPATEALVKASQNRREPMEIQVKVMKQDPDMPDPMLTLHYRDSGKSDYKALTMIQQDEEVFAAAIPAEEMAVFGINYYITAELADYHTSLPPQTPDEQPFSVAVLPNSLPWYRLDLPQDTLVSGTSFKIGGEFYAEQQVLEMVLYYRPRGETEYAEAKESFGIRQPAFELEIPGSFVTSAGVEYYIAVWDDKGTVTYVGDMTRPMYLNVADPATDSKRASRQSSEPALEGEGFDIWADQIVPFDDADEPGTMAATGHVFIGKSGGEPMLRYEDVRNGTDMGILLITPDKTRFSGYGTLYASQVATRKKPDPYDAELYKGWFARNPDDEEPDELSGESDLSVILQVTPDNESIKELAALTAFRARHTQNSKIEVDEEKVGITGSGVDFSLTNKLISFPGYPGVSKISTSIWSRNKLESTSKDTFSLQTIKLGSFDLLSGSVTLDLINWGLEIEVGGFLFGALTGKLCDFNAKKHPQLSDAEGGKLDGFTIGAQINPPAITRLAFSLGIPSNLSSQLTVPHASYSGIPIGVAPTDISLDVKNLGFVTPPSFEVTVEGALYDNGNVMANIENVIMRPLISGSIMLKLDLRGTISSKGEVSLLSLIKLGGYYGHVSRFAPQLKFAGYVSQPVGPVNLKMSVRFEGGYRSQRLYFAGGGGLEVTPPHAIAAAARALRLCSGSCAIGGVRVSASGSAGRSGSPSLKVSGGASIGKYPCPGFRTSCFDKTIKIGFIKKRIRICAPVPTITWKDFNIGATVTLLPKVGASVVHKSSEPGIERILTYVDIDGEEVPALVEFNYGRAIQVFSGNKQRDIGTASPYEFTLSSEYDHAIIRVTSDTGVPQVKATMAWYENEDDPGPVVYTSLSNTDPESMEDAMIFTSSEEEHETLGIIKTPVIGDYAIEILNPDEIGNFQIEVTVPNIPPTFEITSVRQVGATDTEDILEVTYTLTDEDTEAPFVTFRLSDDTDKTDTALFLFPEDTDADDPDGHKLYGNVTEKTVRLLVDRDILKSGTYRLYGQAEDETTAPVVQWAMMETTGEPFELAVTTPGSPETPENLRAAVTESGSGVLAEWDARPEEEGVSGYTIQIQNLDNPDEVYEMWADGGTANAEEIVGLTEGQAYQIRLCSVNGDYLSSLPAIMDFTPAGLASSGSPDLTVDLENSVITRSNLGENAAISVTVTNIGTAASTGGTLEVCYGKSVSEFAVTPEGGEAIGPLGIGETKTYEYTVSAELLTALKEDQSAERKVAADFGGIFRITDVEPNELADSNNNGIIEKSVNEGMVERTVVLQKGWNMVALPVDTYISASVNPDRPENTFAQIFGTDAAVWTYVDGEWHGYGSDIPETAPYYLWEAYPSNGLWVYSPEKQSITMEGWSYDALKYYTGDDSTFKLAGTGEAIDNPLSKFQAADPDVKAVWTRDSNGNLVQNPSLIKAGESFWVSKSATEQPPAFSEPEFSMGLQYTVMILKILAGIDLDFSVNDLDLTQDGTVGTEDAIFMLQQASLR
jgi:hypothetical protein